MKSRKSKSAKPPGRAELSHENRLCIVAEMALNGTARAEIIASCVADFGVEPSTVATWIREARDGWTAAAAERHPHLRAMWAARLESQYALAWAQKDSKALAGVTKLAFELHSLRSPVKLEVTGEIDPLSLSPQDRQRAIDELIARREAYMRSLGVGVTAEDAPTDTAH